MLGLDIIYFYRSFKSFTVFFLTDFIDKLHHLYTPTIILCITTILLSFRVKDLNCLTVENPGLHPYINQLCFMKGTITLLPGEKIPDSTPEWYEARKKYTTSIILSFTCLINIYIFRSHSICEHFYSSSWNPIYVTTLCVENDMFREFIVRTE